MPSKVQKPRVNNINTQITDEAARELSAVRFGTGLGFFQEFLSNAIIAEAARLKRLKDPSAQGAPVPDWGHDLVGVIVQDLLRIPGLEPVWKKIRAEKRRAMEQRWALLLLKATALAQGTAPEATARVPG